MHIVADPIGAYLQTSLSKTSSTSSDAILQTKLQASAKRALLTRIDYEPAEKQHGQLLQALQNKYIVLGERDLAPLLAANGELWPAKTGAGDAAAAGAADGRPLPAVHLSRSCQLRLGWGSSSYPVGAGLVNMGNTCYLNSSLQALFHAPALVRWLLEDSRHASRCGQSGHGSEQCLVCSVARTLRLTHQRQAGAVKPMLLYSKLKLICKHFIHGRQEDAHEFVRHLLDSMQRCHLSALRATKLDNLSKETTPLNFLFGGYLKTQVTCLRCQHASMTYQHFQDLPVDIRQVSTLDDALHLYFKKERLDGADYKCEKCRMKVPATKKFYIDETPLILCIHLKRFSLGGGKITKHVSFPNKLNVSRFLTRPPVQAQVQYCLVSLINHMGPSQNCGHYTAMAKAANGQVYLFDDASVRMTSLGNMLNTNAYVLLYEMSAATRQLLHGLPSEKAAAGADCAPAPTKAPLAPPPPPSPKPAAAPAPPKPAPLDTAGRARISFTVTSQSSPGIIVKRPLPGNKSAVLGRPAAPAPLVPYKADSSGDEEDSGVVSERADTVVTDEKRDAEKPKLSMPSLDGISSGATSPSKREPAAGSGSGCLAGPASLPADQALTVQTSAAAEEHLPRATSCWLVTERDAVSSPASLRAEPVVATPARGWRVTPLPACSPQSDTTSDRAPGHSPHAVKRAGSLDLSEAPRQLLGKISRKMKALAQRGAEKRAAADGTLPTAKRMCPEAQAAGRKVGNSTFFDDVENNGEAVSAAGGAAAPPADAHGRAQWQRCAPVHRPRSPPSWEHHQRRHNVKLETGGGGAERPDHGGQAAGPKPAEKGRASNKCCQSSSSAMSDSAGRSSNSESYERSSSQHGDDGSRSMQSGSSEGSKSVDSGHSSGAKSPHRASSPMSARDKHNSSKPAKSDQSGSTFHGESHEDNRRRHPRSTSTEPDGHKTAFRSTKSHLTESRDSHPNSPDLSSLSRRRQERHYRPRSDECSPERPAAAAPRSVPSGGGDVMSYLTQGAGLSGYGSHVSTWSGDTSRLQRQQQRSPAQRDEYNHQLDAGRTKKIKYRSPRPVPDHNPFQRYQEERRRSPEPGRRAQSHGGRWRHRHHGHGHGYRGDPSRRHSRDRVSR